MLAGSSLGQALRTHVRNVPDPRWPFANAQGAARKLGRAKNKYETNDLLTQDERRTKIWLKGHEIGWNRQIW
jgi:hypothetical protein